MKSHALDEAAVNKCIADSYQNPGGVNKMLHQEIVDRADYGVLKLPEAVVNGVVLRGQTGYGATLELNVAQAICNGFTQRPGACDDIITPEGTLGQQGNAKVTFKATLGFVDDFGGGPLTTQSLSETIVNRLRSTLALKLGVDPQVIQIGSPDQKTSKPDAVLLPIQVNNLKCSDDGSSKSTKVVDSLKGIATCQAEATSDAQVEDEVVVGEKFYFHTASQHGSTNRQVVSTVTEMESDESLCVINKKDASEVSGVPWWGVMLLALFCSGLVFGTAFVYWRNKHKQQMRDEVKAILAEYMPLDDVPSGDQEDDNTRMLEGGGGSSSICHWTMCHPVIKKMIIRECWRVVVEAAVWKWVEEFKSFSWIVLFCGGVVMRSKWDGRVR